MSQMDACWQADPQQQVFRLLLDAYSFPGKVQTLPAGLAPAHRALLAALLDNTVSLHDCHGLLATHDSGLLQARHVAATEADFLLCDGAASTLPTPKLGTLSEPERSATLVLVLAAVGAGETLLHLRGPGIADTTPLSVGGWQRQWLEQRQHWCAAFPLGVDMILCDAQRLVAIPRTTTLEVMTWAM